MRVTFQSELKSGTDTMADAAHLFISNAAGLNWLDRTQLLFSQIRSGVHMGIVTGTVARDHFREMYFPPRMSIRKSRCR